MIRTRNNHQILQNEGVHEFYDRLLLLKSRAQAALENRYENTNQIILPLNDCVLEAFIQGLPGGIPAIIEARNPVTLQEAFEYAIDYEARHQTDRFFFLLPTFSWEGESSTHNFGTSHQNSRPK